MKKILLFSLALSVGFGAYAQKYVKTTKESALKFSKVDKKVTFKGDEKPMGLNTPNATVASKSTLELGTEIGGATYDLQTNKCNATRVVVNGDGTISAVWTFAALADFTDRGTGYNYFDGTAWGANPTARLESTRTGWGNILVTNGKEVSISHGGGGLKIISRTKGTGAWGNYGTIAGSTTFGTGLTWPRAMAIGTDGIIGIASTSDASDTTCRMFKSNDGGATFTYFVPEGLDTTIWAAGSGVGGDGYAMDVRGNVVAFVVGEMMTDVWLFKSTDGGTTFTKTRVYKHPINRWKTNATGAAYTSDWNNDAQPDTLSVTDGRYSVVIDANNVCHVVGGYTRLLRDAAAAADNFSWYVHTPGLWYWKEGQKSIFVTPNDGTAAGGSTGEWNPTKYVDSAFTIVKSVPDLNNDGELSYFDLTGELADVFSFISTTSMPHLAISDDGVMALTFSAINELSEHQGTNTPYRNLFLLTYNNGWNDTVINVTDDAFSEQIFSMGANRLVKVGNDYFYHLLYQSDDYPGTNLQSDAAHNHPVTSNIIYYHKLNITPYLSDGIKKATDENKINSVTNYPNPFSGNTTIAVNLNKHANVSVVVTDLLGKVVVEVPSRNYGIGTHNINIDASNLTSGVYIYNVKADNFSVSNKMIVE